MQVNSVSSAMAGKTSFGRKHDRNEDYVLNPRILNEFANMDDKTIRQAAYLKASHDVNDKKHNRITSALYYSIPLAAGLAAAVRTPALGKYTRSIKLNNFVGTALNWIGTFAAIDLVFGAKRKLEKHSPAVNEFSQNNPVMSTLASIGVSLAAIWGAGKGISKLASKVASKATKKQNIAALRSFVKLNNKLNDSKVLNKMSEHLAKVPSGIKEFAKGVLDYSPLLLIVSSITHSFGHEKVKAQEYANNYRDLKTAQAITRERLAAASEGLAEED